jgi:hypothetical protein
MLYCWLKFRLLLARARLQKDMGLLMMVGLASAGASKLGCIRGDKRVSSTPLQLDRIRLRRGQVQALLVHRVGLGRAGKDSTGVEALVPERAGPHQHSAASEEQQGADQASEMMERENARTVSLLAWTC